MREIVVSYIVDDVDETEAAFHLKDALSYVPIRVLNAKLMYSREMKGPFECASLLKFSDSTMFYLGIASAKLGCSYFPHVLEHESDRSVVVPFPVNTPVVFEAPLPERLEMRMEQIDQRTFAICKKPIFSVGYGIRTDTIVYHIFKGDE